MKLIDETSSTSTHDTILTRVYHHGDNIVRVQVHRNFYCEQSFATAAVLSGDRTWTTIATTPAAGWHDGRKAAQLVPVADDLATRAGKILGALSYDASDERDRTTTA